MKFKNYKNSYNNDNRIYSKNELLDMSLRELGGRGKELLAQYDSIGIPDDEELSSSSNVVYVNAYTRDDGTEVKAHWRSKPNSGSAIDGQSTGGASDIENTQNKFVETQSDEQSYGEYDDYEAAKYELAKETDEYKAEYRKREKEKSVLRKDPDEIAGVKRGEPMTFEQMMSQDINPKYMSDEDADGNYSNNCACCTLASELILRGYDVEAGSYNNKDAQELSKANKTAYLDPDTGEECIPEKIDIANIDCFSYLDNTIKQGERYEFSCYTQRELFYGEDAKNAYNNQKTEGHVVLITRNSNNDLVWFDPQDGDRHEGAKDVKNYLNAWVNERTLFAPRILRIDDKAINPKYVNVVVRQIKK